MDYKTTRELYGPEWFEKYHQHVLLNSRASYAEELIMTYHWMLKRQRFSHYIASVPVLIGMWKQSD